MSALSATLILILPLIYVILQWAALARMEGRWQTAALMPAMFMAAALAAMAFGIAARIDAAALALMLGLPLATLYLLVLWPLHLALRGE